MTQTNDPVLWRHLLPVVKPDGHKYDRGCVVVFGSAKMTGAARLAAMASMRIGAGVCIVVSPKEAAAIYRETLPAHIIVEDFRDVAEHLADPRRNAAVIGPGMDGDVRSMVLEVLKSGKSAVLDAGALTAFQSAPDALFGALHDKCVLTPHEGEFVRIFPDIDGTREDRAVRAAGQAGCTVLLKGAETVIAAPSGDVVLNKESSPYLATAGSGDVLAGMIGGLMAAGMRPFDAACAAAYVHGAAAKSFGEGLVASDLPELVPAVLQAMR